MSKDLVMMRCTTHGHVVPEADVVTNDDNQRVVEWHCPRCGEHLGEFIDGGFLDLTRLPADAPKTNDFELFFENFETVTRSGCDAIYLRPVPLTRRDLLRRFWRQKISLRPRWKACVQIECPPMEEHWISSTWNEHK